MAFCVSLQDYLALFELAKRRLNSPDAYQAFQHHQGELLVKYLESRHLGIDGKQVLDLGCGLGGYSFALQEHGANVVSADLSPLQTSGKIKMFCGDAMALPLASKSMDWVVCASLIEHVPSPINLLREIWRVLKDGGITYISFPPFYTPIGGHQFSPFHLLGEKIAIRMKSGKHVFRNRQWLKERYNDAPVSFAKAWGDWGLYPLSIAKFEKILRGTSFQVSEQSTRWLPLDFSHIPLLREFLTWHVQFLLHKPFVMPEGVSATHVTT